MYSAGENLTKYRKTDGVMLNVLLVLFPVIFLVLYILGSVIVPPSPLSIISRVIFNLLGPLCAFGTYFVLAVKYLDVDLQDQELKEQIGLVLILSVLGIFFAISLTTRNSLALLIIAGLDIINSELTVYLLYAIVGPLVEEFVKIYPALVLAYHIRINSESDRRRYISDPKSFLFFAVIGGGIFNLLETYWFTWNIGSFSTIGEQAIWYDISFQIILRSLNPLHITTALLSGLGIIFSLQLSDHPSLDPSNRTTFISYFLIGVVLHGLWNASALQAELYDSPLYYNLPIGNWILLVLVLIGFFFILLTYGQLTIPRCQECGNWHDPSLQHEPTYNLKPESQIMGNDIVYRCRNCDGPKAGKLCTNCSATEVFACRNCKYPLPIYAFECWKCKEQVTPIYEDLTSVEPGQLNQFSVRMYALFSLMYASQVLLLLSNVTRQNETDTLGGQIILYFLISAALISGLYLVTTKKYEQWGNIVSRYIFGLIILLVVVLFFTISIVFLYLNNTTSGIFLLLVSILFLAFARGILGIDPIFVRQRT